MLKRNRKRAIIPYDRFAIHCLSVGSDKLPALVCVNAMQQTASAWMAFVKRFKNKFRIILFDFPGRGKSEILHGVSHVNMDEQVAIIHQVVKYFSPNEKVRLTAASWGGVTALLYLNQYPEDVYRTVIGSVALEVNDHMIKMIEHCQALGLNGKLKEFADYFIAEVGGNIPEHFKKKVMKQFSNLNEEQVSDFFENSRYITKERSLTKFIDFDKMKSDILFVYGEDDRLVDLEKSYLALADKPNISIKTIPGVGHFLHFEKPEVIDYYTEYLQ